MHLTDSAKEKIRTFYEIVAEQLPNFKKRAGQRQMIACTASAIGNARTEGQPPRGQNIAVIEGKTGVGKTVGYLVPGLVMAVEMNKKLIVSSATVALQEQLVDRDIPALVNLFPDRDKIKVVLAKGRNRYACVTKLKQMTNTGSKNGDMFSEGVWDRPPRADEKEILFKMAKDIEKSWEGDRDELPYSVADDLWQRITNDNNGCPGKNCPEFDACPFVKARQKMKAANVIVANHDFMLTSLAVESKTLPPANETIMVFDEAHHLPEIAVRRFAASNTVKGATTWLDKLLAFNNKVTPITKDENTALTLETNTKELIRQLRDLKVALDHSPFFENDNLFRYPHGRLDDGMASVAESIASISEVVLANIQLVLDAIDGVRQEAGASDQLNKLQSDMGFFLGRTENLVATWKLFSKMDANQPLAKWIEVKDDDYLVSASPLNAADMLSHLLWAKAGAVILTSATMTTLGSFDYYLQKSGLEFYEETMTLAVKSPFNYQEQGQILIPRLRSNPKDQDAHAQEIISVLPQILSEYRGSLVLFASKRQMTNVYESLSLTGKVDNVIMQGQYPKREVLKMHADRIAQGRHSAIFGLAGFGEGVDLPGELCEQVIITKIPFAPPDTPIEMAMQEWVESLGGNAFTQVSLPKAGLMLTQWVGRLIRSETDKGRVVFLDSRMASARYKDRIIAGLPEFAIVRG